jgi:hypothetical protein
MYYNDFFGDIDAAFDNDLHRCFVNLPEYIDALDPKIFSIRAYKGSGKTAFLKQLNFCSGQDQPCVTPCPHGWDLCNSHQRYIIIPMEITDISFETLYHLSPISDIRLGMTDILRDICKIFIISYMLKYLKDHTIQGDIYQEIEQLNKKAIFIEKAGEIIKEVCATFEKIATKDDEFSTYIYNEIFEGKDKFDRIFERIIEYTKEESITILLILDGFDAILDLTKRPSEERDFFYKTIVYSLINLVYVQNDQHFNTKHNFPNKSVLMKILFPEDLYNTLAFRDQQKYDKHAIEFRWSESSLRNFLGKRIAVALDKKIKQEKDYSDFFTEMFPNTIYNTYYNELEDTFHYLLRHTMMRPRDLQEICTAIVTEAVKKHSVQDKAALLRLTPFEPALIKDGVKEGTKVIKDNLEIEFESYGLKKIFQILNGKSNIINYSDLYDILNKVVSNVKETIEFLIRIGIFGILHEGDNKIKETYSKHKILKKGDKFYVCVFQFSCRGKISPSNEDKLVLSPLFYDHLDTHVDDKNIIVYPF